MWASGCCLLRRHERQGGPGRPDASRHRGRRRSAEHRQFLGSTLRDQAGLPVEIATRSVQVALVAIVNEEEVVDRVDIARLIRCGLLRLAGSAQAVGKALGIGQIVAEVLPADKAEKVSALRRQGRRVAMVGDGINDAPALAAADVGIAMATGTDVAMHTAGITLMRGDPALVADALDISRRTYSKIRQNLFWAFIYNVVGLPLAALGLLNPVVAGAAMAFSSVSVVGNALLLRRWMGHQGSERRALAVAES